MNKTPAGYYKYTILDIRNKVQCRLSGSNRIMRIRDGMRSIDLYDDLNEL